MSSQANSLSYVLPRPITNSLYQCYNENNADQDSAECCGSFLPRVGYFFNGIIVEPISSAGDGILAVACSIFSVFARVTCLKEQARSLSDSANQQLGSFTRFISNIFSGVIKTLNPEALIEDGYIFNKAESQIEFTGLFSTEVKDVFDRGIIGCCLSDNFFYYAILARILIVVKTGLVACFRILDLAVGLIAAGLSILTAGTQESLNYYAYNSLKIGALLSDIIALFEELCSPVLVASSPENNKEQINFTPFDDMERDVFVLGDHRIPDAQDKNISYYKISGINRENHQRFSIFNPNSNAENHSLDSD